MRRTAALILGGGPAGSAAAIVLARAGIAPRLVERSPGDRDVVCGGFLSWDTIAALKALGIDAAALGARPIERLRIVSGNRIVEARLPRTAGGLSRRRLDAALLGAAEAAGALVERGRSARAIEDGAVRLDDGETIGADAIFLATGKHELRGAARDRAQSAAPMSAGLRTTLGPRPDLDRDLAGTIELHLFDQGYAGLLIQEDGAVNLCLSVSRARIVEGPDALIDRLAHEAPRLADRIGDRPRGWDAIAGVPYGWRAGSTAPGLFRTGDQAAVIASIAGDGIAIALASGAAAANAFLSGGAEAADRWQAEFARRTSRPVRIAEALRRSAERPGPRGAMVAACALAPSLLRIAARATRV